MPDLRELLHDAAPRPSAEVDLAAVRARVRQRARRRHTLVAGAAVFVVLAIGAAAAAVATRDDNDPGRQIDVVDDPSTTTETIATTVAPDSSITTEVAAPTGLVARAVIADGDEIWVAGTQGEDDVVYRLDRAGNVLNTTPIRGSVRGIALSERYVWVWGGGDEVGSPGGVGFIDRQAGYTFDRIGWDSTITPETVLGRPVDLAVDGDTAWVTDPVLGRLLHVVPGEPRGGAAAMIDVSPEIGEVVVLSDGTVWVRDGAAPGTIAWVERTRTETVLHRQPWSGALLAADDTQIWAMDGDRLVQLDPALLAEGQSVALGERIDDSAGTTWVAVDGVGLWTSDGSRLSRSVRQPDGSMRLAARADIAAVDVSAEGDHLLHVDGTTNAILRWTPRLQGS